MSVGQKLTILKIRLKIVKVMILGNLEAALEEAMQLRGLIKGSNWSLGHYLFGRYEFWKFWPPIAQIPGGHRTLPTQLITALKRPSLNRVKYTTEYINVKQKKSHKQQLRNTRKFLDYSRCTTNPEHDSHPVNSSKLLQCTFKNKFNYLIKNVIATMQKCMDFVAEF